MFSLNKFLVSFDAFGEPITLNYKGSSTFKTGIGAFFTISLRVFILIYGLISLIDVLYHKNPQISQYTIYSHRNDLTTVNFGETEGNIAFGFLSEHNTFPEIDPSIGTFSLSTLRYSESDETTTDTVKEHEIT